MKIVHIIPGSGGSFYCGNCLRDSKYYKSIKKLGHEILKVPMYLPLFSHESENDHVPVFYGAVSLYLKHNYPIFEKAPGWFDKMLNTKPVLNLAANMAGSTRAPGLEEMTISMLLGEHGKQAAELEKMTLWLEKHFQPDVIHISNALLLGLAERLKTRLSVPVVCSLQDEDVWVDVMSEPNRQTVWNLINEKSAGVEAFTSVSNYFSKLITEKAGLEEKKIHHIYPGVDPGEYRYINSAGKDRAIGFLSRMCEANGLGILVDAFIELRKESKNNDIKLIISGGSTSDDKIFLKQQKKKTVDAGIRDEVIILENFGDEQRHIFFERVSVLSVPVLKGEAFGIYIAEAMASGIPVVQPPLGAFPEIVGLTGGGVISKNNTPQELARSLDQILNNNNLLEQLSLSAREGVEKNLNINTQAEKLLDFYKSVTL